MKLFLVALATTAIALTPHSNSVGGDEKAKPKARFMMVKTSDGADNKFTFNIDGQDHRFDVTDWQDGDSQTITLKDGRDLVLRKEGGGITLQVGEDEKLMISLAGSAHGARVVEVNGDGDHVLVETDVMTHVTGQNFSFVTKGGEDEEGEHVFVVSSETAAGEGFSWVSDDGEDEEGEHVFVVSSETAAGEGFSWVSNGGEEKVVVSGLGDLDEDQKARLKDLLREFAGEKDVIIGPSVKHMHHDSGTNVMIFGEDGEEGKVKVIKKGGKHIRFKTKTKKEDQDQKDK
jgi:hypothetical protein